MPQTPRRSPGQPRRAHYPFRLSVRVRDGAAANAGGPELRETARRMEHLGNSGDFAAVGELMPRLATGLEQFRTATERFRDPGHL